MKGKRISGDNINQLIAEMIFYSGNTSGGACLYIDIKTVTGYIFVILWRGDGKGRSEFCFVYIINVGGGFFGNNIVSLFSFLNRRFPVCKLWVVVGVIGCRPTRIVFVDIIEYVV